MGAFLSVAALGAVLYAIIEAPTLGWTSPEILTISVLAIIMTYLFVNWERKVESPMLPIGFFRFKGFSLGLIAIMLASFVMFSFMFTNVAFPTSKVTYCS